VLLDLSPTVLKADCLQCVQIWRAVLRLRWSTFSNLPRLSLVPEYPGKVAEQGSTAVVISAYLGAGASYMS